MATHKALLTLDLVAANHYQTSNVFCQLLSVFFFFATQKKPVLLQTGLNPNKLQSGVMLENCWGPSVVNHQNHPKLRGPLQIKPFHSPQPQTMK